MRQALVGPIFAPLGRMWGGLGGTVEAAALAPIGRHPAHGVVEVVPDRVALIRVVDPQVRVAGLASPHGVRDGGSGGVGDPATTEAVDVQPVAVRDPYCLHSPPQDVSSGTAVEGLAGGLDGGESPLAWLSWGDESHGLGGHGHRLGLSALGPPDEDLVGLPVQVPPADLADGPDTAAGVGQDGEERQPEPLAVAPEPVQDRLQLLGGVGALLHGGLFQLPDLGPGGRHQLPLIGPVPGPRSAAHVEVGGAGRQVRLLGHVVAGTGHRRARHAGGPHVLQSLVRVWARSVEAIDGLRRGLPVALAEGDVLLVDLNEQRVILERQLSIELQGEGLGLLLGLGVVVGARGGARLLQGLTVGAVNAPGGLGADHPIGAVVLAGLLDGHQPGRAAGHVSSCGPEEDQGRSSGVVVARLFCPNGVSGAQPSGYEGGSTSTASRERARWMTLSRFNRSGSCLARSGPRSPSISMTRIRLLRHPDDSRLMSPIKASRASGEVAVKNRVREVGSLPKAESSESTRSPGDRRAAHDKALDLLAGKVPVYEQLLGNRRNSIRMGVNESLRVPPVV